MNGLHVAGGYAVASSIFLITANVATLLYHSIAQNNDYDADIHFGAFVLSVVLGGVGLVALGA